MNKDAEKLTREAQRITDEALSNMLKPMDLMCEFKKLLKGAIIVLLTSIWVIIFYIMWLN